MNIGAPPAAESPVVAIGPGGSIEVWPSLTQEQETTDYALSTGLVQELRLYTEAGFFRIRDVLPSRRFGPIRRFLARTIYNPRLQVRLEYEKPVPFLLEELKDQIAAAVAADEDILTQFHEASTITAWLRRANTFADVVQVLRRAGQEGGDA
jgi:hypothetical protein